MTQIETASDALVVTEIARIMLGRRAAFLDASPDNIQRRRFMKVVAVCAVGAAAVESLSGCGDDAEPDSTPHWPDSTGSRPDWPMGAGQDAYFPPDAARDATPDSAADGAATDTGVDGVEGDGLEE